MTRILTMAALLASLTIVGGIYALASLEANASFCQTTERCVRL